MNVAFRIGPDNVKTGLGVLVRDSKGVVAAAMCSTLQWSGDVIQAHARSILVALKFAYDIGLRLIELDVGCTELLGLLHKGSPCYAPMGVLVDDICFWISCFKFLSFSVIRKDCNKASQALATEALSSNFEQVWLEDHSA